MFKHHLKMTLRHLRRHKGYSFINIFGLAVSFTVVIFIALFIKNEKSFDRNNVNLDRMYVVMMGENEEECQIHLISAAGLELDENIPEILEFTRFDIRFDYALQSTTMDRGLKRAILLSGPKFVWTDPGMFRVFTYKALAGDLNTALDDPYSIVLTKAVADKLFGSMDPLGQVVRLNNRYDLKVTGVVEKPKNSHIDYGVFGSVATQRAVSGDDADRDYQYNSFPTYVLLPRDHDPVAVSRKINDHMASVFKRVGREVDHFFLYPVKNLYLSPVQHTSVHGSSSLLWILFTIAVFILLIAGINFINLSTARASVRAGEIGIKKVVGVMRKNLVRQFLGESVFVALLSLAAAVVFVVLFLPAFNRAFNLSVSLQSLVEPLSLLSIVAGVCLIGVLAGLYPAFFLSAFPPASVLRGDVTRGRNGGFFRKALIVFQFAVSVVLLSGTLVVLSQIRFVRSKDLGFRSENVLVFPEPHLKNFQNIRETVKAELLRHPDIQVVSVSHGYPGRPWNNESLKIGEDYVGFTHYSVDADFDEVYGLELLAGRFIDHTRPSDFQRAVVLNETAVREFGLKNPVGAHIPF
ncbi:MAG: ABC transporter permease, partial [Candidatus Aminicenantes bacterium]|nr:ABC transporter permease [Candidatus Aminicenantes bacterium]